jgi:hypothetical protein
VEIEPSKKTFKIGSGGENGTDVKAGAKKAKSTK